MSRLRLATHTPCRAGYLDDNGTFVPFETADEVFSRARALGARILLRLWLDKNDVRHGMFYTNDMSLCQ